MYISNNIFHKNAISTKDVLWILVGSFIYSIGIAVFLSPNAILPGGVMGIAIILSKVLGKEAGTWYFILNVPIIIIGYKKIGLRFIVLSAFSVMMNSLFTNVIGNYLSIENDLLLVTIAGSVLVGLGLGIVLKVGSSTGGMDIIVKLLRIKYPILKTSTIFMIMDISVLLLFCLFVSQFDILMYSSISVYIVSKVLDFVLYGSDEAKLYIIITENEKKICQKIISEIGISATIVKGEGAFTLKNKNIVLCVIKKRESPRLEEVIKLVDYNAFTIVTRASEIYGEGYKNINQIRM